MDNFDSNDYEAIQDAHLGYINDSREADNRVQEREYTEEQFSTMYFTDFVAAINDSQY